MAKMGRPFKDIDQKQFENLCALQCTIEEICAWFDVCPDTLEYWCKRTYDMTYSKVFKAKRGKGKISLRRAQFRLAENNASMAIWLGKQYLEQHDTPEVTANVNVSIDDALTQSLKEEAARLEKGTAANEDTTNTNGQDSAAADQAGAK